MLLLLTTIICYINVFITREVEVAIMDPPYAPIVKNDSDPPSYCATTEDPLIIIFPPEALINTASGADMIEPFILI
jgi:hypothetical protein